MTLSNCLAAFTCISAITLAACAVGYATPVSSSVTHSEITDELSSASVNYADGTYELNWAASEDINIDVLVSKSPDGSDAKLIAEDVTNGALSWTPEDSVASRRYFVLTPEVGESLIAAARVLPLEQSSNFRDIGGYVGLDGRRVKWGKVYRSGAMPLLTETDMNYIEGLNLDSVIDFRSIDEREVVPDQIDDRTGALFISNDYSIATLMQDFQKGDGENMYAGMERMLAPQYRSTIRRILADEGAVLYHCSAGQDRTGVATALIYDVLGVDREIIQKDYHMSTELRRTQWEMPDINPDDFPGNFIVQYYMAARKEGKGAEPLYTPSGASHIVQFFAYIDDEFGGSENYLKQVLGFDDADIATLRETLLD